REDARRRVLHSNRDRASPTCHARPDILASRSPASVKRCRKQKFSTNLHGLVYPLSLPSMTWVSWEVTSDEYSYSQSALQHVRFLDRGQALPASETARAPASLRPAADPGAARLSPPRLDVLGAWRHLRWHAAAVRLSGGFR